MPKVRRGDIDLHYEVCGSGRPVLLAHSFLCDGRMWRHQVDALEGRCRLINADLRGHGRSGPVRAPTTLDDVLADHLAVLDDAGVDACVWVGLSIGGMTALRAALKAPDRVLGLAVLDSHAGPERLVKKLKYGALGVGARLLGLRPLVPAILPLMFGRTTLAEQPELVAEYREIFSALDLDSVLSLLPGLTRRESVVGRLGEIRVPTRVIVGEEDLSLPPADSAEIAGGIPGAELTVVPGAGHLSALEQPEAVNRVLLELLESVSHCLGAHPRP